MKRWLHDHLFGHHYHMNRLGTVAVNEQRPVFQCSCKQVWFPSTPKKYRNDPGVKVTICMTPLTRRDTFARYAS